MASINFKPRLLRETAEIALTEIKRYIEPRLEDEFSLRRVSAPLFLEVGSPLLDPRYPGVRITIPGMQHDVEIVGSLDVWLRGQLARYDSAPGFGVFTIMNAIRPGPPCNATSSPHIAAWAWQQAADSDSGPVARITPVATRLYAILVDTEKMILEKFPHLTATLQKNLEIIDEDELARKLPDYTYERRIYEYLHPGYAEHPDRRSPDGKHCAAIFVTRGAGSLKADGELWVWNRILNRPLQIADIGVWGADAVAGPSVGGNIFRDNLAMQLLHQNRLL